MRRRNRGFTLLEILVALTLTAILLVIVYSALQVGIRAQRSIAASVEHGDAERALAHFLRRQLRHVATDVPESLRFTGGPHSLRFTLRGFRGDPWLYRLQLEALPATRPLRLAVAIRRIDSHDGSLRTPALSEELLGDLRAVRLAFFGRLEHESEAVWHGNWSLDQHPPQLVRLHYRLADGRGTTLFLPVAGSDGNQVAAYAPPGGTDP